MSWLEQAACRTADTSLFYPDRGVPADAARTICRGCPVRLSCLEHAIVERESWGIWGGTNRQEREALRRSRRRAS